MKGGSGRNGPCPCGSSKKAKRCCGIRRGPSPAELAKAFLAEERRKAGSVLRGMDRDEFDELFEEMIDLPTLDVSLQADLPRLLSPELEWLRAAIEKDDDETFKAALAPALKQLDTPPRRAALARALLSLRDTQRINARVAALAIIDLETSPSALFQSSVVQALAVSVGAARTPSGLLVASR